MRAILKIIPGNGSEECLDWAAMLTRMFVAWGEKGGWLESEGDGEIRFTDLAPQGVLEGLVGVHRLTRNSPHDPAGRRTTSFCTVRLELQLHEEVRTYVLDPYAMVKDRKTGRETEDIQFVLDGGVDSAGW